MTSPGQPGWTHPRSAEGRRRQRDKEAARRKNCIHRYANPLWGGILGWRWLCDHCGDLYVPGEHADDDACEMHPQWKG